VDKLAAEGIKVELIDLRTIAPLDQATLLASVAKTGRAVVVHEAVRSFGVGAEIASLLHENLWGRLKAPVERVGAPGCPVPFSRPLEMAFLPQAPAIEAAIRKVLG
jgi:pyruvate dehydrogenase E1 component beta subunit